MVIIYNMQSNDTKNANNQLLYFFVTSVWVMIWNHYYIYVCISTVGFVKKISGK